MVATEKARSVWGKLRHDERVVLRCIVHGQKRDLTCTVHDMNKWTYTRIRGRLCRALDCQTDVDITWAAIRYGWVRMGDNNLIQWLAN